LFILEGGDIVSIQIQPAYNRLDLIRELFTEYTDMLGIDLTFQGFDEEIHTLPGKYALPKGRLYIAVCDDDLAGCIALRPLDEKCCEMKRLFVRPQFRGLKIGKLLIDTIIAEAKNMQYKYMVLDSLSSLEKAVSIYKSMGFCETEPYYNNPIPGAVYLRLDLGSA